MESDRLCIRPFREADAEDLLAYLKTPGASCFLSMKLDHLDQARAKALERAGERDIFAVEHRATGRMIGEVFGHLEPPDTFSIAWQLNPDFGGQGLALEAASTVIDHLFRTRGVRRIYAYVETDNAPSRRLCERLGMRLEGVFREFVSFATDAAGRPVYVDTQQFAILRREWRPPLVSASRDR